MARDEIPERLTRLETNHDNLQHWFEAELRESIAERAELRKMVGELTTRLDRQMTFVGGIVFAVSAIWAFATYAWKWIIGLGHN